MKAKNKETKSKRRKKRIMCIIRVSQARQDEETEQHKSDDSSFNLFLAIPEIRWPPVLIFKLRQQ